MNRVKVLVFKVATALAVLGAAVGLGACGTTTVKPMSDRQLFLYTVHQQYPHLGVSDQTLVRLAKASCKLLQSGMSGDELIRLSMASVHDNATARRVGYVIGAGVATYCPKYKDELLGNSTL